MSDIGRTEPLPSSRGAGAGDDLRVEPAQHPREGTAGAAQPGLAEAPNRTLGSERAGGDGLPRGDARTGTDGRPERAGDDERGGDGRSSAEEAIAKVQQPANRAKLLLAIAAVTLLNLILLLVVLSNVTGATYERVDVEGAACVIETGGDESILYCQR